MLILNPRIKQWDPTMHCAERATRRPNCRVQSVHNENVLVKAQTDMQTRHELTTGNKYLVFLVMRINNSIKISLGFWLKG